MLYGVSYGDVSKIYSILAFGFSAACSLSRPPYVVRWCRMRPSFSHSSDTSHIALSLTGSGSSCSSVGTSIIALVALKNFLTSQKKAVVMHTVAVSVWPVAVTVYPELPRPIALPPPPPSRATVLPCPSRVPRPPPRPPSPHTPRPAPRRARRPLPCHPSSARALNHSLKCTCHSSVCPYIRSKG